MSVRLEWTVAEYTAPEVLARGDEAADGNVITHDLALVIGPLVIEGNRNELQGVLDWAQVELNRRNR